MQRNAVNSADSNKRANDNLIQMQELESRRLMAATVALPFRLDFSNALAGTVLDKDGQGTGFGSSQAGAASQIDINTAKGTLSLTADYSTSKPSAVLETAFDGTTRGFTITARILGPLSNLSRTGDQTGIYLGPDQNNAVKLTAVRTASGNFLQFTAVINGQSVTADSSTYVNIGNFSSITSLDVQLIGDAVTGQVSARYALNGKSYQKLATTLTVPQAAKANLFNSASKAGIVMADKHGPVTAVFDSFSIDAGVTAYVPVATLSRPKIALSDLTTSGSSNAQTLRITNTGDADLTITALTLSGDNAGEFKITNPLTSPITLKTGQRYDFYVTYTAANSGTVRNATLNVTTNDPATPTQAVTLRGLGLAGAGGTYEPALQRIIDMYGFKTNTGQSTTSNAFDSSISSPDEVDMPRITKAGAGPVSFEMLGVFANQISKTTFGWYEAGNPQTTYLVGGVDASKAQSLSPLDDGILYFDPGTGSFGVYGNFTLGSAAKPINRNVYSEDILNSWETNSSKQKKVRFYKLRDESGNVVANSYIVTFEEYNVTFDQNDIVGIIRNVQPAAAGAELGLENLDGVPAANQLVMSRVDHKDPNLTTQTDHDTVTLRVRNTGNQPLSISSMVLSDSNFTIVSGGGAQTLAPNAFVDVKVKFVYTNMSGLGSKVLKATLIINSNDADEPAKTVKLSGIWQSYSENQPNGTSAEPTAEQIVEAFGYGTTISTKTSPINTKGQAIAAGDEVLSELWQRADTGLPVGARMLATYHQVYNELWNTHSILYGYDPSKIDSATGKPTVKLLLAHNQIYSQSVLPTIDGSATNPAFTNWIPSSDVFGFNIDGQKNGTFSQAQYNTPNDAGNPGHGWRFYVAKDANGNIIPDTYIACQDYVKVSWANYDYQDNIILLTNIKPVSAPQTVQGVKAASTADGVAVTWTKNTANDITSYNVYRRVAGQGSFTKVANVSGTNFVDTTGTTGTWYDYYVTAAAYQGGESAQSTVASAAFGGGTAVVPPTAASGVNTVANNANSVTVTWTDTSNNETGFRIERKTANGTYASVGTVAANVLTFTDTTASGSTSYVYRVVAFNAAGDSTASNESAVTTPAGPVTPPTTTVLTSANVGNPTPATSVSTVTAGKDYDVTAGGADIYGTSDSFNFLYEQKSGDFDVSVRVASLSNVDPSTMAGLMVRESLGATSRNINIKAQIKGLRLTYRTSTGGTTTATGTGATNFPNQYLRLARVGNVFTTYTSTDGVNWTSFGSVTMSLGSTVYVGLATCSKNSTTAATASYRGYGNTGSVITNPTDTAPATPTSLAASANTPTSVALTWADNATNETGYLVERQTNGAWASIATLAAGSSSYTDSSVSAETAYGYRVTALGSSTNSAASNIATVTTPPSTSTGTNVTLTAAADTYVTDATTTTNYGTAGTLQVKKSSAGYNRQAFISFDISSLSTVNTAKLRLFAGLNTADSVQIAVAGVSSSFNESTVTWSTKPAVGSTLGTATVKSNAASWFEIDISAYVKAAKAAGQTTVTLSIAGTASTTAFVNIASRESGANGPQLAVT